MGCTASILDFFFFFTVTNLGFVSNSVGPAFKLIEPTSYNQAVFITSNINPMRGQGVTKCLRNRAGKC